MNARMEYKRYQQFRTIQLHVKHNSCIPFDYIFFSFVHRGYLAVIHGSIHAISEKCVQFHLQLARTEHDIRQNTHEKKIELQECVCVCVQCPSALAAASCCWFLFLFSTILLHSTFVWLSSTWTFKSNIHKTLSTFRTKSTVWSFQSPLHQMNMYNKQHTFQIPLN